MWVGVYSLRKKKKKPLLPNQTCMIFLFLVFSCYFAKQTIIPNGTVCVCVEIVLKNRILGEGRKTQEETDKKYINLIVKWKYMVNVVCSMYQLREFNNRMRVMR